MENSKKIIKIIIVVMLVICLICGILIYKLNKRNNYEEDEFYEDVLDDDLDAQVEEEYQLEKLKAPSDFFSVEKCIQNNIDENFIAKEMNFLNGDRIISYSIYGYISSEDTQSKTEKYFILRNDIENDTFSIEELNENYDNIDQIDLKTNLQEIKSNGNNIFEYIDMSEEQICREYYDRFSKLELENPEEAYELLDADYKKERFPTFDEYQKYVNEYKDIIEGGVLSRYSVEYEDDYTEYVLVDVYNNSYTIQATSVMEYTIKLDNYTIKVDDYEEKYQELKDENKVQANVHIFLQMINTKDYKHAYGLLDESFKQSNFDTLEKFEQYVKNNFFSYNLNSTVSSELSIKKEGEYYIYNTVLRNNSSSAAESKELTIIMQLKQGTDFVMSFSL